MIENYCLSGPESYTYLNQSGCIAIEGVDDSNNFQVLQVLD